MGVIRKPGATLGVLTGINVLNYLDRYMGGALLTLIIADLRISQFRAGILQASFIVVYSLVSPLVGWLGDKHKRLRLAAVGVVIWSAATFGSGLAQTFTILLLARALVGVGEASYSVVTPSLIADLYPADRRGRALAIFYSALAVGPALGYMIGTWIGEEYGWRKAFFVGGGPGFVIALFLLALQEPPRGRFDRPGVVAELSLRQALAALRGRPSYLFNTVAQTIYTFTMGGLATWMPKYFVDERHLPLKKAGFLFGLCLLLAGFIGVLAGGQIGDRLARRYPGAHFAMGGWTLVASVPFTAVAILAPQPVIFWPAMFVTLLLLFINTGPLNAAMANVLPPALRARGFALYTVAIHMFGDAPSPPLIGLAADHYGLRLPVLISGLLLGVAGLVLLAGRRYLVADLEAAAR
jgi:MFS family permease